MNFKMMKDAIAQRGAKPAATASASPTATATPQPADAGQGSNAGQGLIQRMINWAKENERKSLAMPKSVNFGLKVASPEESARYREQANLQTQSSGAFLPQPDENPRWRKNADIKK